MSKIAIAVGSFITGVCVAFAESCLLHASPQAQRPTGLETVGAEPVVPPLNANFVGGTFSGPTQPLDGFNCEGYNIIAPVLTYAGGAFRCENCAIHSSELEFKGAALNTMAILRLVGAIKGPPPENPAKPQNSLMEAKMEINIKQKVTWVGLGGVAKVAPAPCGRNTHSRGGRTAELFKEGTVKVYERPTFLFAPLFTEGNEGTLPR